MIKARVWLRNQYITNSNREKNLKIKDFKQKARGPYDFIKVNRKKGVEHVIYD